MPVAGALLSVGPIRSFAVRRMAGAVPAEAARRLLAGEGRPGAYTPAALFGPALAEACGGKYQLAPAAPGPTAT